MEKLPEFEIIRSSRKTVSLEVTREGKALVRAPIRMKRAYIDDFVLRNREWLISRMERRSRKNARENVSDEKKAELAALAKVIMPQKVEYFAKIMNVQLGFLLRKKFALLFMAAYALSRKGNKLRRNTRAFAYSAS